MSEKGKKNTNALNGRIQFVWGHMCSLSAIDQERNNVSLFNIVEQINIPAEAFEMYKKEQKPILFPYQHEIVVLFRKAVSTDLGGGSSIALDMKVSLIDPNNSELMENLIPIKLESGVRRFRQRVLNTAFLVTRPGDYVYRIQIKESTEGSFNSSYEIPIDVKSR